MPAQRDSIALVAGQQAYSIVFGTAFSAVPTVFAQVEMPNSSGEMFFVNVDLSTLTVNGVTVYLSGEPTSASNGGFITWQADGPATGTVTTSSLLGGITVPQLFSRIGRRARTGDFTTLDLTEQMDLAEAANTALMRMYNLLPTYFKEQTVGFALPAPVTLTGVAVTQYSKTVTAATFTEAQLGATVQLAGDPQFNQVTGTDTLLNPYMGTTGTVGGTVYGDAIFSPIYPLDRIIGNPTYPNQGSLPIVQIGGMAAWNQGSGAWFWQQTIGTPLTWWVQTFGNAQGHSPFVVLKFAPLPDQAYPVSVRISYWPKRITLADYQAASTLVVPSQFIEPCLIPMCLDAFMSSPAWKERGDEDRIFQKAQAAESFLRGQPGRVGAPANRVGTPLGF